MPEAVTEAPERLYHSPLGLYPFQVDGVARTYWQWTQTDLPVILALWDTGIGKSHLAMATSAWLFEDALIDHVIVVAEANKVLDWFEDDFPTFTDLSVAKYASDPKGRQKILDSAPQVLVMSWETGRNDICTFKKGSTAVTGDKMLAAWARGKRVAIVFDEFSRMRSRSSKTYISWDYLVNRVLRKTGSPPLVGLTATTVENSPADHFNACRVLAPALAGSVADFEANHVAARNPWDNKPSRWKNLTPADCEPGVIPLNQRFMQITMRKKKTDDDVIDFFPKKVENPPTRVVLGKGHQDLYDHVQELFDDEDLDESVSQQGFMLLRQLAGHPLALAKSEGRYAQEITSVLGAGYLERLGCAKVDAMLAWQASMAQQQTVIFSFYGGSILPLLQHELEGHGYSVAINSGQISKEERQRQQNAFKAGDKQIFLSSDAGAKGLNLGVGSGLLHYETPLLYSTFDQRSNRIHRIDSRHPSVTIDYLLAADTVEVAVTRKMLTRNQWAEKTQDADYVENADPSEAFLTSRERKEMLRRAS